MTESLDIPLLIVTEIASHIESIDDLFAWRAVNKRTLFVLDGKDSGSDANKVWRDIVCRNFSQDALTIVDRDTYKTVSLLTTEFVKTLGKINKTRFKDVREFASVVNYYSKWYRKQFEDVDKGVLSAEEIDWDRFRSFIFGCGNASLVPLFFDTLFAVKEKKDITSKDFAVQCYQHSKTNFVWYSVSNGLVDCLTATLDEFDKRVPHDDIDDSFGVTVCQLLSKKNGWFRTTLQEAVVHASDERRFACLQRLTALLVKKPFVDVLFSIENDQDEDGSNMLHLAVQSENPKVVGEVKRLLDALCERAAPMMYNQHTAQSLFSMFSEGLSHVVEHGHTPLHRAAQRKSPETALQMCEALLNFSDVAVNDQIGNSYATKKCTCNALGLILTRLVKDRNDEHLQQLRQLLEQHGSSKPECKEHRWCFSNSVEEDRPFLKEVREKLGV